MLGHDSSRSTRCLIASVGAIAIEQSKLYDARKLRPTWTRPSLKQLSAIGLHAHSSVVLK